MGSPKFEIAEQIKMWIVVYLVCFLALYCVLSALHALYDPLNLPALTWPISWFLVPEMTSFGSALLAFVLTPGLCSIIAVLFGKSIFKKAKTKIGNDSNLLIVFYVQIMPDDFVMQLHR
ncbi:hypothetical protein PO532_23700, partial [Escherichia coli]